MFGAPVLIVDERPTGALDVRVRGQSLGKVLAGLGKRLASSDTSNQR